MSLLAVLICLVAPASADVGGIVRDAWTERPVSGARVTDAQNGRTTVTDSQGRFSLALAGQRRTLFVEGGGVAITRFEARASEVVIDAWPETPPDEIPVRWRTPRPPGPPSQQVALPGGPLMAVVEDGALPQTIRVGRRLAGSCRDNPVQRIDEIDLDEYVEGVVNAEVGVFRAVQGGADAAAATWAAFGVAARSYALWFYLRDPDADFHIDDTACNQVYKDARNAAVDAALVVSAGVIMVKADDGRTLDKLEYAASCAEHGTLPEYGDRGSLIPDAIPERACAGNWCGHDNCGGHEVNPSFPDEGRCLVRGICQWGSVERSMRGDSWQEILAHYQPHLELRGIADDGGDGGDGDDGDDGDEPGEGGEVDPDLGVLVGFVRDGTAQGPGIEGASVQAGELPAAVTDTDGFYRIEDVTPGDVTVRAQVAGRIPQSQVVAVLAGKTHWVSFALPPPDSHEVPSEGEAEGEGEIVVAEGPGDGPDDADNPEGPVGAPGAGGDVEGTSLTSSKKSGSVGCATTGGGAWWRPRR